ncbi:Putative disease resistance protein [Glycine soja]|nr:Putative disease resistance protein [Glycine soja]
MTNLRFLQFYDGWDDYGSKVPVPTGFESLSDKLRYLHWEGFCLESLPLNFCAEQLVELYMPFSKLKKLWDGVQNLVNLKIIGLQGSKDLIEVPDLSKAEKLEIVNLSFCVSLLQLHVYSKSLQGLNAKNCSSLKEFSVTSEEITELNLADTAICELPPSIWQKKKLAFLVLNGCKNLKFVGNEIVHLLSSKRLDLSQTNIERLPALPPSLKYLMAEGCTSLETNFTQHLVLHHMIQSRIPYLHKHPSNPGYYNNHECFFFPGDRITKACGFCTGDSSITIPYLPKSDLHGFIYCIIFSEGIYGKRSSVLSCSINQDGIQVGQDQKTIYIPDLFLDHVLFWYHDIRQFDRIREVCDHFSDLTISFEHKHLFRGVKITWGIKECGVFPVYARASGFKVVGSNSKETFECESITQISNNESQPRPRAIRVEAGVRGSNNENEEDRNNFLQQKRMRTSP